VKSLAEPQFGACDDRSGSTNADPDKRLVAGDVFPSIATRIEAAHPVPNQDIAIGGDGPGSNRRVPLTCQTIPIIVQHLEGT